MTLPRFTSGSVGNLNFSHLNEAFGYIDLERGSDEMPGMPATDPKLPLVVASITGRDTGTIGNHSWKEIAWSGSQWTDVDGGRSSTVGENAFAYPARTIAGTELATGSQVTLVPKRTSAGAAYYLALSPPETPTRMVRINGVNQVIIANRMWSYNVRVVNWDPSAIGGPQWVQVQEPYPQVAFNGCENAIDDASALSIGVGTVLPVVGSQSGLANRMPIKTGTVVLARQKSTSTFEFSIPNGYRFECP